MLILLGKLANGYRFKKSHFEEVYLKLQLKDSQEEVNTPESDPSIADIASTYSYEKISIGLEILSMLLTRDVMFNGPQNFIYFNGLSSNNPDRNFPSGITTFNKGITGKSPFKSVKFLLNI